ncbi:flagellin N-terminal helical domain-containing protein [Allorhizobium undicola]|uniref:flagellin N-terminal helical domain-containing protein n=1 Tax=Allorhizobium undicola TaxID=78527 RepID=UPI0004820698|nr:flagellin [Allorhizobium undicola]
MTSINTNNSAIAALKTLRSISDQLDTTQSHISSGYKVGSASDNAAYWSIATTMRSDNKALGAVQDALGMGAAKVDTASTGMEAAIDVVSDIKAKLVAAREPGVDKDKINKELTELKNQLTSISKSASFNGENWLYSDSAAGSTQEMVGSFVRDSSGNVSVKTITFDSSDSMLINDNAAADGLLTAGTSATVATGTTTTTATYYLISSSAGTGSGTEVSLTTSTSDFEVDSMISSVDAMLTSMTDAAATIGATKSRINSQSDFAKDLSDTLTEGVGKLVDADMNEESTKLKALQTQQQLGIQALSIANSNSENVLSLFR